MKNLALYFLSFLLFSPGLIAQKVAILDQDHLMSTLPEVKEAEAKWVSWQRSAEQDYQSKVDQLRYSYERYQQQLAAGQLSPRDQEKILMQLQAQENELQVYQRDVAQELEARRAELFQVIHQKVQKAAEEIAAEQGFELVIEKANVWVVGSSSQIPDITSQVHDRVTGATSPPSFSAIAVMPWVAHFLQPKITITERGGIRYNHPDGSYDERVGGVMYLYDAKTGRRDTIAGYEAIRADVPKPLGGFVNSSQQDWLNTLEKWLTVIAEDQFNEIRELVQNNQSAIDNYLRKEKAMCKTIFEIVDYRHNNILKIKYLLSQYENTKE